MVFMDQLSGSVCKGACLQDQQSEFIPQDSRGGDKELTSAKCPPTSMIVPWRADTHTHMYIYHIAFVVISCGCHLNWVEKYIRD